MEIVPGAGNKAPLVDPEGNRVALIEVKDSGAEPGTPQFLCRVTRAGIDGRPTRCRRVHERSLPVLPSSPHTETDLIEVGVYGDVQLGTPTGTPTGTLQ